MNSTCIAERFERCRREGRIALMPFVPAGYPSLDATAAILPAIESAGADLIEIGFPFSDPVADGPTIQQAFTEALARGVRVGDVFKTISFMRSKLTIPLVGMVSYSIVFRYGVEKFAAEARTAGFDGLIVPDLPPPEAQSVCGKVRAAGLDTVLLIAPTTPPARRKEIADLCSGFVYYLSVAGVTGARNDLPPDVIENVRQIKSLTDRPVCVGFGISTAAHVQALAGVADGAIVGSALVRAIGTGDDAAVAAGAFVRALRE